SVILIRTKKRNAGVYANVSGTRTAADVMSESVKGGVGYQMENGLNFFGDFLFDDSRFTQKREYHESASVFAGSKEFKSMTNANVFNHTFRLMASRGVNYDFRKHSMGVKYTFTRTPSMRFRDKLVTQTNLSSAEEISSISSIFSQSGRHYLNYYAYFTLPKTVNLRVDFDYVKNNGHSDNSADEEQTEVRINNVGSTVSTLYASKIELEKSWDKFNISGGGDYTYTKNCQKFTSSATGDAAHILNPATDDVKQNLYSGFFSFDWKVSDKWQVYGGLRYDGTRTKYIRNGKYEKALSKNYDDFLPNIGVRYQSPVTLGIYYKESVYRPSYSSLDNNYTYVTPTHWETGNPALQKMKSYELGLNLYYKKFMFQAEGTHYIRKIGLSCYYDPSINASVSETVNLPHYNMLQIVGVQRLDVKLWHPTLQGVLVFQDLNYGSPKRSYKTPYYQLSLNNRFDLPHSFYAYLSFFLRGDGNIETQYCGASWQTAITVSRSYKGWNFTLSANDIFGTWKQKVSTFTNNVYYSYMLKGASQYISLSVRYQFQSAKRQYKGKSVRDDELNRLE
ncbi:MAG: outer membrane beta-barrel family protein, partial [Muribaculaceae bacterium]|nr:outer membrane beta-barrel family protein [Muribaculaceae bacterium]